MGDERERTFESAPRAGLANVLARLYDAQLDMRDAAAPWLVGELPAPATQLKLLADRLHAVRELEAELHGELRAVWFEIKAERERQAA